MGEFSKIIEQALLIRRVENELLSLAHRGLIRGPVHTCNGQELTAIAYAQNISNSDLVFSTHRCHGHYLARTGDVRGLIAELMGKRSGICFGVGASQHLCNGTFFSNGVQGGGVPIAVGAAFSVRDAGNDEVVVCFIGDGTLGEGVVYEAMNIASLVRAPIVLVCENNLYAQTTRIADNLAGSIVQRANAFGISTIESSTWDVDGLFRDTAQAVDRARDGAPIFHLVNTYRLNSHSRSSDFRGEDEVARYVEMDPVNRYIQSNQETVNAIEARIQCMLSECITEIACDVEYSLSDYTSPVTFEPLASPCAAVLDVSNVTVVENLNQFFINFLHQDQRAMFVGEDVLSPYGGAFRVAAELSNLYPKRVISTPISEAGIVGFGIGLAISGRRAFVEIMFGDFLTLAADQIINHAAKFFHMYGRQIKCPLVVRAPMGGGMGFGPTHSQTLERLFVGVGGLNVVAINSLIEPAAVYRCIVADSASPTLVVENKRDYFHNIGTAHVAGYIRTVINEAGFPIFRLFPDDTNPYITLVTYGGIARDVWDRLSKLVLKQHNSFELLVLTKISPLTTKTVESSVRRSGRLLVIEEGGVEFGIGGEIVSRCVEAIGGGLAYARRVGALPYPIPSSLELERAVLPTGRLDAILYEELVTE